jgi:DNA polymerase-3 subunit epsilon
MSIDLSSLSGVLGPRKYAPRLSAACLAFSRLPRMFGAFADARWVFVDVETTGASPARERITEVGIVTVEVDGDAQRVTEWSSLVNPGVPIPAEIQWLTGISNEMVREAPRFADIADALYDRLSEAIFVAHNARFDYGFLKAEFARAGYDWRAPTLCTVRLSRYLYPDRGPHSLDAIVARFGLDGEQRHRALGDARVLWRLLQRLLDRHGAAELETAVDRLLARPSTPPALPQEQVDAIPHAPGVYLLYGANAHPIYIGKSVDLKARVLAHFANDHASGADLRLSQEVRRIEWEATAGETGALLREAELVKTRLPAHNIALRRKARQVWVALDEDGRPRIRPVADVPLDRLHEHYGPFSSRPAARRFLQELAAEHGLCLKTMGLERRSRVGAADAPCFNYQIRRCRGACTGAEPPDAHAQRLRELLELRRVPRWPYAGAVALVERDAGSGREDLHVFDRWCWLGTARSHEAAAELATTAARLFDADQYRIAVTALVGASALAVVELAAVRTATPQTPRVGAIG